MRVPGLATLRGRVRLLAIGITALVILLAAVPLALLLRSAAYADAEREATYAAQNVSDYLSSGTYDDAVLDQYLDRVNDRTRWPVTIVMSDGDVLGADLPDTALKVARRDRGRVGGDVDRDGDADPRGYGDGDADNLGSVSTARTVSVDDGRLVEILADDGRGQACVVAAVDDSAILSSVRTRYALVGVAALVLLLLAGAAAEVTSRRLVRPLRRTADTAGRLSAGDLTARAPEEGPAEVAQVAVELNALAGRIDELLTAERESTADLSHRLRTPLTAVRLGVEALPASERKLELEQHVASLERTLTQVIRAARRPQREGVHPRADATQVVRERLDFWTPLAEDQERAVVVDMPDGPCWVRSSADDLATTIDALLENVMAHTPEGTPFGVRLALRSADVVIEVHDEGPGIPPGAVSRGQSDRGSSGLGLDIARSTTEAVGGAIEVRRGGGTTTVRLTLPTSGPPSQPADGQA